jgi:hypothetical protein
MLKSSSLATESAVLLGRPGADLQVPEEIVPQLFPSTLTAPGAQAAQSTGFAAISFDRGDRI